MAWQNLNEELSELFDELSLRAEQQLEALDEKRAAWLKYRTAQIREWRRRHPEATKAIQARYEQQPQRRARRAERMREVRAGRTREQKDAWNAYLKAHRAKKKMLTAEHRTADIAIEIPMRKVPSP